MGADDAQISKHKMVVYSQNGLRNLVRDVIAYYEAIKLRVCSKLDASRARLGGKDSIIST
jgi:hypothetical protein